MRLNGFFPPEATSDTLRIVLTGQDRLLIERHCGIISYNEDKIYVRLKNGYLTVCGEKLLLSQYGMDELCIAGHVKGLEFSP